MDRDTRPVRCYICRRKMYYSGHPKHEDEVKITDTFGKLLSYVHARCVKTLRTTTSINNASLGGKK